MCRKPIIFVDEGLNTFVTLDTTYLKAEITTERDIVGSIYLEKLSFDGSGYRTVRTNEKQRTLFN